MKDRLSLVLAGLFLALVPAAAQYRDLVEAGGGDPSLRDLNTSTVLEQLSDGEGVEDWASSYLAAEGTPPPRPDFSESIEAMDEDADLTAETQVREEWNRWARMYGPAAAQDGKPETAWVEGVEGSGEGEVLIFRIDPTQPVQIWNGFQRSRDLFAKNGRIREAELFVLFTDRVFPSQFDVMFRDLHVLGSGRTVLKDRFGAQPLVLPRFVSPAVHDERPVATFVALRILSVYPGSKYQDTAVSEIGN